VPPETQASITAAFLAMRHRVDEWETRVGGLVSRLELKSANSSRMNHRFYAAVD
jgi:hypothetical protein